MGSAKLENVDYDEIVRKSNMMAERGVDVQRLLDDAFNKIKAMRENWFGNSYDNFVNGVNSFLPALNELGMTTVITIPTEIIAKAKSYAAATQAECSVKQFQVSPRIYMEIEKTNKGSQLRFRSAEIENTKNSIKTDFEFAKDNADSAIKVANQLSSVWSSISGDNNIKELIAAYNRVKSIIDNISSALVNQIAAQANTIEAIETTADIIEGAGKVVEGTIDAAANAVTSATNVIQESAVQTWKNITGKN